MVKQFAVEWAHWSEEGVPSYRSDGKTDPEDSEELEGRGHYVRVKCQEEEL